MVEGVERLLEVVDLDVLGDDRPEIGESRDRCGRLARRDAKGERGGPAVAGGVLDRDDVAAEVASDRQRLLGRRRERVLVVDGEREGRVAALRPAGRRWRASSPSRGCGGILRGAWQTSPCRRVRRCCARPVPSRRLPRSRPAGDGLVMPTATAAATARPAAAGARAAAGDGRAAARGGGLRLGRCGRERQHLEPAAPRSPAGASRAARRRSRSRSSLVHPLLESLERPAQPRRDGRGADPEHARGGVTVELEHDPQREHLALAGRERRERGLELGREALGERLLDALVECRRLLAPSPSAPRRGTSRAPSSARSRAATARSRGAGRSGPRA